MKKLILFTALIFCLLLPGCSTPTQNKPDTVNIEQSTGQGKIKGNINSKGEKIYHVPSGAFYDRTIAEEYFNTEEDAKAAGYRKSKR